MCGIAGYLGKRIISDDVVQHTLESMKNRGPDAQSFSRINDRSQVLLLHSRLSIIDLDSRSNQPFARGDLSVVFNGEIYNYVELRSELRSLGSTFETESDTEVLLEAYLKFGEDCVKKFEGMWAFAIYDKRKQKLFLSRDRFAEKPLYYMTNDDGFYFASEVNFLKELINDKIKINEKYVLRYLANGYKSLYKDSLGFLNNIKELSFASSMVVEGKGVQREWRYWDPVVEEKEMSFDNAVEGFRHHLFESMRIRLRSDVPISFCLSGGVDSASLVSIAAKEFNADLHAFSIIDEDERYNELDNIKATLDDLGCSHTLINISTENSLERLKDLIAYHGVPLATVTFFVHSFITEAAAKGGYKVIFAGHAADEMVTGYYDHFLLHLNQIKDLPEYDNCLRGWQKHILPLIRNPLFRNPNIYIENPNFRDHIFFEKEFQEFLKEPFFNDFSEEQYSDNMLRNRMLNEIFHEGVRVILHEDDLNSMKYSIENRCPYLDTNLFNFSHSIPSKYLIKDGYAKRILRESMKGTLNDQVRLDRQKKGFNAGVQSVFDFSDSNVKDYLLEPSAKVFDFVHRDKIENLLQQGRFSDSLNKFVFNFINVRIFMELYE